MKALTIWQPWASLILIGAKPYEFRTWPAPAALVGKRIAIHAGARPMKPAELEDLHKRLVLQGGFGTGLLVKEALPLTQRLNDAARGLGPPVDLPLASVVGTAILGKPVRCAELFKGQVADSARIDQHKWAWPLTEIAPFEPPLPARGAQGFWEWSAPR